MFTTKLNSTTIFLYHLKPTILQRNIIQKVELRLSLLFIFIIINIFNFTNYVYADNNQSNIYQTSRQIEITEPDNLLNSDGSLKHAGWSKQVILNYNKEVISNDLSTNTKEWEHYTIISPKLSASITLAHIGLLSFATVDLLDHKTLKHYGNVFFSFLFKDELKFPKDPFGTTRYNYLNQYVDFVYKDGKKYIEFYFSNKLVTNSFYGKFVIKHDRSHEGITISTPFSHPDHFFYEHKASNLPVDGYIEIGRKKFNLDSNNTFAVEDWGRGVWPHKITWYWGHAIGRINNKTNNTINTDSNNKEFDSIISINLGYGYGNQTNASVDALAIDNKIYKLGRVKWYYNPDDLLQDWSMQSEETEQYKSINLKFTPFYQNTLNLNFVYYGTHLKRFFGNYNGYVTTLDGQKVQINNLYGFAEIMTQKW